MIPSPTMATIKSDLKYAKQSGGQEQYGHVVIEVEPQAPGEGYVFENAIVRGVIPKCISINFINLPKTRILFGMKCRSH